MADTRNQKLRAAIEKAAGGRDDDARQNRIRIPKTKAGMASRKRQATDPGYKGRGGWMGQESSLVALDMNRHRTYVQNLRKCANCGRVALRNSDRCYTHDRGQWRANQKQDPMYRPRKTTILRREIQKLLRENAIPSGLAREPLFVAVHNQASAPWEQLQTKTGGYGSIAAYRRACWRLLAEMIHAWVLADEHGDVQPWVQVATKARKLGLVA